MLSSSTEPLARTQAPVPVVAPSDNRPADLRAELELLNADLRELKSTDHSVRAYFETWIALVLTLSCCKLVYDWQRTIAKPPYLAIPLMLIAIWVFLDSMKHRRKFRELWAHEQQQLNRQRELRQILGLDTAEFSSSPSTANPSVT